MALEQEYQIEFFEERGFQRKECPDCGSFYWTLDPSRDVCGDPPCVEYGFIGEPLTDDEYTLEEMRERFLNFLEDRGHERVERRPVAARWRDDIYLTIASIADFQPHVTSGEAPPPANPLCVSQPCIRLNDLDSVGRSGRHLTTFEMMAHHAFNDADEHHYFKDRTVELCHEFMTKSLGMDPQALTYIEKPWAGGGNAGPAFEVVIGGLEVATLVFMNLEEDPDGDIELYGDTYSRMDLQIVDTGYGLERLVWASNGAPTIYDAIYPGIVEEILERADLGGHREDPKVEPVLQEVARLSSIMDVVDTDAKLEDLRSTVHERITEERPDLEVTEEELQDLLEPLEAVYAVADHTRCLAFMLGDGIVPSNVKAGYLVRLVVRRTLRLMDDLGVEDSLADLVTLQLDALESDFPELKAHKSTIETILDLETRRFRETLETGKRLVRQEARDLEGDVLGADKLVEFYDSHGIPPDIVEDVAAGEGVSVEVPDDFYKQVAQRHAGDGGARADEGDDLAGRVPDLPATERLYYQDGGTREFEGVVLWSDDDHVVLDQTAFYPQGGGQPADTGHLLAEGKTVDVEDVHKVGEVVVHEVSEGLSTGDVVTGRVDWGKRMAHTRHHTATHVVIGAARDVLGDHVWQAGAQKGAERSRIDLTHFRRISDEELRQIEQLANMVVLDNHSVEKLWMRRDEAENKYGTILYQGGIPRGEDVRVVRITDFDVEYCGGTHVNSTSDVGPIKILDTERVQDGVERIHFSAGLAAVREGQRRDSLLEDASEVFDVPITELPSTAERFFEEWKEYRKQVEDLQEQLAELKTEVADTETVAGREVLFRFPSDPEATRDELQAELTTFVNEDADRVAVGATPDGDAIVCASDGTDVDCPAVFDALVEALGGKGGGRGTMAQGRLDKVDEEAAREAALGVLEG